MAEKALATLQSTLKPPSRIFDGAMLVDAFMLVLMEEPLAFVHGSTTRQWALSQSGRRTHADGSVLVARKVKISCMIVVM